MTYENNDQDYRLLEFLKSTNRKLHIKIISGGDKGMFRNGFILDISLDKRCLVFIDSVLGEIPYLFEEIDIPKINFYKDEKENDKDDKYKTQI